MTTAKTLLILSQVFIPDPASVGQHIADVAIEMVERGWTVTVLTSDRGYDDPSIKYPKREVIDGVKVIRLPMTSFGKRSIFLRLIAGNNFVLQCIFIGLFIRKISCVLVSTSPPMCSLAAVFISIVRRIPIKYWVMDLNPDQMIELGFITEKSITARIFNWMNRIILKRANNVIVLDRFMAERINNKCKMGDSLSIIPPWPHQDHLDEVLSHSNNPFRKGNNFDGKFVIMYSGNHSYTNPIRTILDSALKLQNLSNVIFVFVGGGLAKAEVDEIIKNIKPSNIFSLPYQPFSDIKYSLSAADVHVVSVGDKAVGVVHPCKVYGAMAVSRPIILIGPDPCHISDIIRENRIGWHIKHGDIDGAISTIREIVNTSNERLQEMGNRARILTEGKFSKKILLKKFCDVIES